MAEKGKKQAKLAKRAKKKVVKVFNGVEIAPCMVFLERGGGKMFAMESKSGKLVQKDGEYVPYSSIKTYA